MPHTSFNVEGTRKRNRVATCDPPLLTKFNFCATGSHDALERERDTSGGLIPAGVCLRRARTMASMRRLLLLLASVHALHGFSHPGLHMARVGGVGTCGQLPARRGSWRGPYSPSTASRDLRRAIHPPPHTMRAEAADQPASIGEVAFSEHLALAASDVVRAIGVSRCVPVAGLRARPRRPCTGVVRPVCWLPPSRSALTRPRQQDHPKMAAVAHVPVRHPRGAAREAARGIPSAQR